MPCGEVCSTIKLKVQFMQIIQPEYVSQHWVIVAHLRVVNHLLLQREKNGGNWSTAGSVRLPLLVPLTGTGESSFWLIITGGSGCY